LSDLLIVYIALSPPLDGTSNLRDITKTELRSLIKDVVAAAAAMQAGRQKGSDE